MYVTSYYVSMNTVYVNTVYVFKAVTQIYMHICLTQIYSMQKKKQKKRTMSNNVF